MLVSLPLVLLLIDYWPLGRFGKEGKEGRTPAALVLEKAPLFLLAAASSVVTLLVQRAGGAVGTLEKFPLWARAGNALVAYVRYLKMFFWPVDLAVLYPHPGTSISGGEVLGAGILLVALSAVVIVLARRAPYLFIGWFWFLVTLLPVIGLVQVGVQAMADRYTYVPFIGLFVAMAWGVPAVARRWRSGRVAVPAAAVAVLLVSAAAAAAQVRLWKNTETLFVHALRTTKNNFVVENNLGDYLSNAGRAADALPHITEALRLRPDSFEANINMGRSLVVLDRLDESIPYFSRAVRIDLHSTVALNNLARARFLQGEVAEAIPLYEAAVAASPGLAEPRRRLAVAHLMEGRTAAALSELESAVGLDPSGEEWRLLLEGVRALERNPDDPAVVRLRSYLAAAHRDAGLALQRRGKKDDARIEMQKARELVTPSLEGTPGPR
jgi:tetratricopeptide (TPR) repeat protein